MAQETGIIIAIKEIDCQKVAIVECVSKSACGSCHQQNICGVGVVAKAFSDKKNNFTVNYEDGMQLNTKVDLQISNSDLFKTASFVYLLPLIFLIASALLAQYFLNLDEGITILISLSSMGVGFVFMHVSNRYFFPKKQYIKVLKYTSAQ
ncbi:SoxR reducing system RseC family protein [Psychromonas sp. CD1]|uniref:SoxR reducing system RseC family protein n=1 Tax=Psychromonas sp. CD1 TaxID=1979839 RepID=UPI000B9A67B4|nr:SoxR reducing system RseC family protein [Psychromonas sp. CD1]